MAVVAKDEVDEIDGHYLQYPWTFFVFNYSTGKDWHERLQKVTTFNTVEKFWGMMLHTLPPSEIANGTDLYIFKDGIEPMWEDPKNERGGRWFINVPSANDVNRYWEELLMLIVGNTWETEVEAEEICGVVFQPRSRGAKISLWTSNWQNKESVMRIGRRVKEVLDYPERLYYQTVEEQKRFPKGQDILDGMYSL